MDEVYVTVVEHEHYLKKAESLLTTEQMAEIADIVAADPKAGDLIQGTGGCRKLRYAGVKGKGKSGGMRVIHFFIDADQEVHLLDIYGKNQKVNLTKQEKNELAKLTAILKGEK